MGIVSRILYDFFVAPEKVIQRQFFKIMILSIEIMICQGLQVFLHEIPTVIIL